MPISISSSSTSSSGVCVAVVFVYTSRESVEYPQLLTSGEWGGGWEARPSERKSRTFTFYSYITHFCAVRIFL